jgi:hypothetical protein
MLRRAQTGHLIYIKSGSEPELSCRALRRSPHGSSSSLRNALATLHGMKTFCLALLAAAFLAACEREGPLERAGEKVDRAIERTGDKIEDATDRR